MSVSYGEHLLAFQPEPFPEIAVENVHFAFEQIIFARQRKRKSYGGFVLRTINTNALEACWEFVGSLDGSTKELEVFGSDRFAHIHRDIGRLNSVTVHQTTSGEVEAAVILGTKKIEGQEPTIELEQEAQMFFESNKLDGAIWTPPERVLAATLRVGDVLLFDHSRLHIFHSRTHERTSTAFF